MEDLLAYALAFLIGIFIAAAVFAWLLGTAKRNKMLTIQTMLMVKMAEQQGISADWIDGILNTVYHKAEKPEFLVALGKRK